MSSVHRRAGLPCGLSFPTLILQMWPTNCSMRRLITSTNVIWRLSVFRMLLLVTLSFQHTLRRLLYALISNANILQVSSAFRVHVSAAYIQYCHGETCGPIDLPAVPRHWPPIHRRLSRTRETPQSTELLTTSFVDPL